MLKRKRGWKIKGKRRKIKKQMKRDRKKMKSKGKDTVKMCVYKTRMRGNYKNEPLAKRKG